MSTASKSKPRVLCVDDEPLILESLNLHLRRHYDVHIALGGAAGLETLNTVGPFAVVLSDMRMPRMDGASFLSQVQKCAPETVRMLLTGETSIDLATKAVNEGQIFRFLTKPCPPEQLLKSFKAAVEQHRLISAERVLLQETLLGSIKALIDVLGIINPVSFSRATRIKRYAHELAKNAGVADLWQIDVAAMFSQLGYIALPSEIVEKIYCGEQLSPDEEVLASGVPKVAEQLLGNIPRLETVMEILKSVDKPLYKKDIDLSETIPIGARILRIAIDFDALEAQGRSMQFAADTMKGRTRDYDCELLNIFLELRGATEKASQVKEMLLRAVKVGVILADEVRTDEGLLIVPRGFEVTPTFLYRVKNLDPELLNRSVKVIFTR